MKTYLDCLPCFLRQTVEAGRFISADTDMHEAMVRAALEVLSEIDFRQSPPAMSRLLYRRIAEITGIPDPYADIKKRFNMFAIELYPLIQATIATSHNPLETAIKLAIAGNIIDFGIHGNVDENQVRTSIGLSLSMELHREQLEAFEKAIANAESILYLADNAGEIVFDKALIEQIPCKNITVAVKGSPIINDATMEDAEMAGLCDMVKVIDNGADAPGTILDICSEQFRAEFDKAELVISKGQGNYETLSDVDKNIYFLLKAKCPVIAGDLECVLGDIILRKTVGMK